MSVNAWTTLNRALGAAALVFVALGPLFLTTYWASAIFTQALWYGIAAASLIFLSAFGGMVSLGQTAIYGIAGLVLGNLVTNGQAKGSTSAGIHGSRLWSQLPRPSRSGS